MTRIWSYGINNGFSVSNATFQTSDKIEGATSSDYSGSFGDQAGFLSTIMPVKVEPLGPTSIILRQKGPTEYYLCVDRGTVSITDPKPSTDINPEQDFIIDTAKDLLSLGAGYLSSKVGSSALASSLVSSAVTNTAVGVTVAGAVSSSMPLVLGSLGVLASQIALNYAKVALVSPPSSAKIKVNSSFAHVRVYPPYYQIPSDYTPPPSSSSGGVNSGGDTIINNNYDVTAQYFDSFPSWNSGGRHSMEGQLIDQISDNFKNIIKDELKKQNLEFSPTQEEQFNTDFWNTFKTSMRDTLEAVTSKRATDSYKNELNEISKRFKELTEIIKDNNTISKDDLDNIFSKYFLYKKSVSGIETSLNIPQIFDTKDFSTSIIELSGGDML